MIENYDFAIRTMIHESAHATLLLISGLPFSYLTIIPESGILGKIQLSKDDTPPPPKETEFPGAVDMNILCFIIAGVQAELIFLGDQNGGGINDYCAAYEYIKKNLRADSLFHPLPDDELTGAAWDFIHGAETLCRSVLKRHGDLVFTIAKKLNEEKTIGYEDLRKLADEYFQTLTNEV